MSFNRIKAVFFRHYFAFRKGPQQFADLFYWPLVDIFLWGLMSIWITTLHKDSNITLILMTGLVFWQMTWRGSVDISQSLIQEFWQRNLINLFSTPLKMTEWVCGVALLSLYKFLLTAVFGLLAVYLLYSLNILTIGWMIIPLGLMLLCFGWTLGFIAASIIVRWGPQLEVFAWMIGFIFAPFSAVFYPIFVLPEWAQCVSWSLPTTYIFEGMRMILENQPFPSAYFWKSLTLNIIYLSTALLLFIYSLKKSRMKGLARLN